MALCPSERSLNTRSSIRRRGSIAAATKPWAIIAVITALGNGGGAAAFQGRFVGAGQARACQLTRRWLDTATVAADTTARELRPPSMATAVGRRPLCALSDADGNNDGGDVGSSIPPPLPPPSVLDGDVLYLERFRRQRDKVQMKSVRRDLSRPPNPFLTPHDFVTELLNGLRMPDEHDPDSGARTLIRSSTPSWRQTMRQSVGAPSVDDDDYDTIVASSLRAAMGRPNNQFGILVGGGSPDAEEYVVSFPSEELDYGDGQCWLECRLRGRDEDELLVVMGWSLERREEDGAWLVDRIDWQDFRDEHRPGVGREEWERICG